MKREDVLSKAKAITVDGCRNARNEREGCFQTIAMMWGGYLTGKTGRLFCMEPMDVCAMMALLKVARLAHGRSVEDSLVDIAGYAACAADYVSEDEPEFTPEAEPEPEHTVADAVKRYEEPSCGACAFNKNGTCGKSDILVAPYSPACDYFMRKV